LIDCLIERMKYGSVRRVHRHEQANSHCDAGECKGPPEEMPPQIGPAQKTQQDHRLRSSTIRPSRRATVREQRSATSRSCVTISTVEPSRACKSSMSLRMSWPVFVSRLPVGSSASKMGG